MDFLEKKLAPLWGAPGGAVLLSIAAGFVTFISGFLAKGDLPVLTWCCLGLTLLCLVTWSMTNRLPMTRKGKIGIMVAITSEDDAEAKQIHEDFVNELQTLLENDRGSQFHVIILTGYWAKKATRVEYGADVLNRARAHLLFSGTAKRRQLNGQPVHFLSLGTVVRHVPIPQAASDSLAKDMDESLPKRMQIPVDGDAVAFEATSQWVSMGAKFVVGVAMGFAGNLQYAERLFLEVERQLKSAGQAAAFLQPLARQVPRHLRMVYEVWLGGLSHRYYLRREKRLLLEADTVCDKLIARDPGSRDAHLVKGICAFVLTRDLERARAHVERTLQDSDDTTGNYSLAFLFAYEGKLKNAHTQYRLAFKRPPGNPTVPIQCEEFINIVISEEPDKQYLCFCTALINYNAKEDFDAAKRDFQKFIALPESNDHAWAKAKAVDLVVRCDEKKASAAAAQMDHENAFPLRRD